MEKKKSKSHYILLSIGLILTIIFGSFSLATGIKKGQLSNTNISLVETNTTLAGYTGNTLYYASKGSQNLKTLDEDSNKTTITFNSEIVDIFSDNNYVGVALQDRTLHVFQNKTKILVVSSDFIVSSFSMVKNTDSFNILIGGSISVTSNYLMYYQNVSTLNPSNPTAVTNFKFSPIGTYISPKDGKIYSATQAGEVYEINVNGNKLNENLIFTHSKTISSFHVMNDGNLLIGSESGRLSIYSYDFEYYELYTLETGKMAINTAVNKSNQIVSLSSDGILYTIKDFKCTNIKAIAQSKCLTISQEGTIFASREKESYVLDFANAPKIAICSLLFPISLALGILSLIFFVLTIIIFARKEGIYLFRLSMRKVKKNWKVYLMLLPMFAFLAVFIYVPVVWGLSLAFRVYENGVAVDWTLYDNFKVAFEDPYFWSGAKNMFIFLITDLLKALVVPLIVAELIIGLTSKKMQYASKLLMYIVGVIPGVATMLIWRFGIYGTDGLLNSLFASMGIKSLATKDFLGSPDTALASIIMIGFPWVGSYLVVYGGLTSIPKSYYDAGKLEGCKGLKRIFRIDIPMLKPQFKFLFTTAFISSLQEFNRVYLTTEGGPNGATYTPSLELFLNINTFNRPGVAGAMGVMLFALIFGFSLFFLNPVRKAK